MWVNKVIIITGSGMGIGYQLAQEVAKEGGTVVLNDIRSDRLSQAYQEMSEKGYAVGACEGDVTSYEACQQIVDYTIQTFGKLDVLINNAGITAIGLFEKMKPEVFKKVIDVNIVGVSNMTYAALPTLKKTKGSILFVGSQMGLHGMGKYSAYCTSKMALTGLWESLQVELQGTGVHVGLAYVGAVKNSKKKTFLNDNGSQMGEPDRVSTKRNSPRKVARQLMRVIEKRRPKTILTLFGKIYGRVLRLFPCLIDWIMKRVFRVDKGLGA